MATNGSFDISINGDDVSAIFKYFDGKYSGGYVIIE